MLAAVLRSDTAVRMSIKIIDAFVAMRRTLASIGPVLARIETVERRQITDQSRNEARFDAIFEKMSEGEILAHQIFYQNRFWDAKSLLVRIIRRAKKELIVVDAYPGVDAGRLTFGVSKMGDSVIPGLLANLRNATSARKEYGK